MVGGRNQSRLDAVGRDARLNGLQGKYARPLETRYFLTFCEDYTDKGTYTHEMNVTGHRLYLNTLYSSCTIRGVARVCGARGKEPICAPLFFCLHCQKIDPFKICAAKSDKKRKKVSHISHTVKIYQSYRAYVFIRPIKIYFPLVCEMVDPIFFTLGTISRPRWKWSPGQVSPFAPLPL